jgi:uncharacterized protein YcbX
MQVSQIHYYPIKSCKGTALTEARIGKYGIVGDRAFMITDENARFLTQREYSKMALIKPTLVEGEIKLEAPNTTPLTIPILQEGERRVGQIWKNSVSVVDQGDLVAEWLSAFLGASVRLMGRAPDFVRKLNPAYAPRETDTTAFADGYPLLIISEASLDALNARLIEKGEEPVPMNRFRTNIVVRGCQAFAEDNLPHIRIGDVVFNGVKPCPRCPIPTIDQETGERTGEPIKTLNAFRRTESGDVLFGNNLIHANEGTIRVDDDIVLLS